MRVVAMVMALLMAAPLFAEEGSLMQPFYFGGGFGSNKVPEFDEVKTGIQVFGGYRLAGSYGLDPSRFTLAVEAGYMDTSDADRDGFWVTPVVTAEVAPLIELLLRGGVESGHDEGLIYGGGIGYRIERNMAVRLEYVEHPEARSVMFNVVVYPWAWPY